MNPSLSSTPEISKPMVSALRMAPVTVLARGASATIMAIAAGMPMNSAEVCSRCLATVTRYHMMANVTARMTATKFHCARRVLSSSIAFSSVGSYSLGITGKINRQAGDQAHEHEHLRGGKHSNIGVAGQQTGN